LEYPGSGISSLWARTTALKHDCAVVVGYPEKVDITASWPASPEYYNSAIVINNDGETITNYRKSFLYPTDETWALEGPGDFFKGHVPKLGHVSLGISTDINPYRSEAPWDAFEFAVTAVRSDVVVVTMAWHTPHDIAMYSRKPQEPDLEAIVYWVQRLEPIISAKKEEEVTVVFCNRTGSEGGVTYTGTSAVLGIRRGEVFVYGMLGRGVKELLIVDTSKPPISKLTEGKSTVAAGDAFIQAERGLAGVSDWLDGRPWARGLQGDLKLETSGFWGRRDHGPLSPISSAGGHFTPTSPAPPQWPPMSLDPKAVAEESSQPSRLQALVVLDQRPAVHPVLPAPLQKHSALPKLTIPSATSSASSSPGPWRFNKMASPFPKALPGGRRPNVLAGEVAMTPISAFDPDSAQSAQLSGNSATRRTTFFWALTKAQDSVPTEEAVPALPVGATPRPEVEQQPRSAHPRSLRKVSNAEETVTARQTENLDRKTRSRKDTNVSGEKLAEGPESPGQEESRAECMGELSSILEGLRAMEKRPGSALEKVQKPKDRPFSPKSRNASRNTSRSRVASIAEPLMAGSERSASRDAGNTGAKAGILDSLNDRRPHCVRALAGDGDTTDLGIVRPTSRASHHRGSSSRGTRRPSMDSIKDQGRPANGPDVASRPQLRNLSNAGLRDSASSRRQPSMLRFATSQLVEDSESPKSQSKCRPSLQVPSKEPKSKHRSVSRGRQPGTRAASVEPTDLVKLEKRQIVRTQSALELKSPTAKGFHLPERVEPRAARDITPARCLLSGDEDDDLVYITIPPLLNCTHISHHRSGTPSTAVDTSPRSSPRASPRAEMMKRMAARQPSDSKKGNLYDIPILPPSMPPLTRAPAGELLSASTVDHSPGPLTPQRYAATPEPMIIPTSPASVKSSGGGGMDSLGLRLYDMTKSKSQCDLPRGRGILM